MLEKVLASIIIFVIALVLGAALKQLSGLELFLFAANAAVVAFIASILVTRFLKREG